MVVEAIHKNLAGDGQQRASTMVVANLAVSLIFINVDDGHVIGVQWNRFVFRYDFDNSQKVLCQGSASYRLLLGWNPLREACHWKGGPLSELKQPLFICSSVHAVVQQQLHY